HRHMTSSHQQHLAALDDVRLQRPHLSQALAFALADVAGQCLSTAALTKPVRLDRHPVPSLQSAYEGLIAGGVLARDHEPEVCMASPVLRRLCTVLIDEPLQAALISRQCGLDPL